MRPIDRLNRWKAITCVGMALCLPVAAAEQAPNELTADRGAIRVTASAWETMAAGGVGDFPPEKTLDGDLKPASSWRAEVEDEAHGQWIAYDLGQVRTLQRVDVAFLKGNERSYRFAMQVSTDGETWNEVFRGASSGKADGFESFAVPSLQARHVRLAGTGNTSEKFPKWFNIVETRVFGR